jgi:large subunit ribosomal protein L6
MSGKIEVRTISRIGRRPVEIPVGVKVTASKGQLTTEGPKGTINRALHAGVVVNVKDGHVLVERLTPRKFHQALHGLWRSLVANDVLGVSEGYRRTLELNGVGYRAQQSGDGIVLTVGLSHSVEVKPLPGVVLVVEGNDRIHVSGIDKQKVGEMVARIRRIRPPDAYKGKGIRYAGEVVRLKPGKAGKRAA